MKTVVFEAQVVHKLVGKKWVHEILVMLLPASRRYNKLAQLIPEIKPSALSNTLKKMIASGLVYQVGSLYHLTDYGRTVAEIVFCYIKSVYKQLGGL
jgi:DNA-binding HxlR family transcriptional regulator